MNDHTDRQTARALFRRNLIKVLAVQVLALLLLWLMQTRYAPDDSSLGEAEQVGAVPSVVHPSLHAAIPPRAIHTVSCTL